MRTELLLGLACFGAAILMLAVNRDGGVATMLAIGLAVQGITYLAAPAVVGIAEHELRRQPHRHLEHTEPHGGAARSDELQPAEG